ncbi:uncharacterized protein LOC115570093 [Xyrichtys novacula]|uniref:Uncharacterized protein LOC115570093 n=1 Tax=Xyrichtys novacula TaxID=13765 RepID=A0AAV1HLL9_XYRNO|nr:uncharacterized protein LOC115570093 [Xyrichtys novacula]
MSHPSDDKNPARRPVTRSQQAQKSSQALKHADPTEESDTMSLDADLETGHGPPDFDMDEERKRSESSGESESSEEEHMETAENQPMSDVEMIRLSEDAAPSQSDSDVQKTNDEQEEPEPEERTNSSLSSKVCQNKTSKCTRSESERSSTACKSTRKPKPPMRFTYEKPGHPSSEPVTIMHHGMVIQLKLHSPNRDHKPRKKVKSIQTIRRRGEQESPFQV